VTRVIKSCLSIAIGALLIPIAWPVHAGAGTTPRTAATPPPSDAPLNLTATAGNARVTLAWEAVAGATGYRIVRATAGVWDATPFVSTTRTTYTNSGLTNGTPYTYRVLAYTGGGNGPPSNDAGATPMAPPSGVTAAAGDTQVTLMWNAATGALTYTIYRSTSSTDSTFAPIATDVSALTYLDAGLTNGTRYYYRLKAFAAGGESALSVKVSARPLPPPPDAAPGNLFAKPGNARVTLTWNAVDAATSYRVFRSTDGIFSATPFATVTATTFKNTGLTNGTAYTYRVVGRNMGGDGPFAEATATPLAPPAAPTDLSATAGDKQVAIAWTPIAEATAYNLYRGTRPGREATTPVAVGISTPSFVDLAVENGPTYYYKVTGTNIGGESPRSAEANATPEGPPLVVDAETQAAFRLLRQATWGPRPGDVDRLKSIGAAAFLDEQFAAPVSTYPNTLYSQPVEMAQEHFMQLALTGPDQLRQRVAWALHKIWVVSAVEVDKAPAIVTYYRLLMNGAFGNYRDLMRNITLNPAMGRYLNMLNNRSQRVTGDPPNENYAREVMQLFTLGTAKLNPDGTQVLEAGAPIPAYGEDDVKALARILTGWTFGDGNAATVPRRLANENYKVPMEAVAAFHDAGEKFFLGQQFVAGQTAMQDLDQALEVLFNHPNIGPFVSRQLIQQLVTSNPSPAYVADIANVFNGGAGSARGDLGAVVRAILAHTEAALASATSGKLAEPVLFVVSPLRALNASVTDHPFMSNRADEMGQKVFYPPSVFSYFSPGYRVRGTAPPAGGQPLVGPEFQILTSVTALVRANFIGDLLGGRFGSDATVDFAPFTSRAKDAAALADYCNLVFMGGKMTPEERREIVGAVRASSIDNALERARTAMYLTLVIAQSQVDR